MKYIKTLFLCINLVTLGATGSLFFVAAAHAAADPYPYSNYPIKATADPTSTLANGEPAIQFELTIFGYQCPGVSSPQETKNCSDGSTSTQEVPLSGRWVGVYVTGTGNVFKNVISESGVYYVVSDGNGHAAFGLGSTVAETKSVGFADHVMGVLPAGNPTIQVNFTPVTSSTPSTTNSSSSSSKTTVVQAAQTPPKLTAATVDGKKVDTAKAVSMRSDQTMELEGTAKPGVVVHLTLNTKNSRTTTVDANEKGDWNYTLKNPEAGSYIIEATTSETADSVPSEKVSLLSFAVKDPPKAAQPSATTATPATQNTSSKKAVYGGSAAALLCAAVLGYILWRKKTAKSARVVSTDQFAPTPGEVTVPSEPTEGDATKEE